MGYGELLTLSPIEFPVKHASSINGEVDLPLTYTRQELITIGQLNSTRPGGLKIPIEACQNIRKLRLNKKRKRGCRGRKKNRSVNWSNLHQIRTRRNDMITNINENISMSLANVQSLRSKELLIHDYIHEQKIDMMILTETWLSSEDAVRIDSSELNKNGYRISTSHRKERKGGGLALVYRENIKVKKLTSKELKTFQLAVWKSMVKSTSFTILAIYRPPYSAKNKSTTSIFLDEFTDYLTEFLPANKNIIICGDFNFHVNDKENSDAQILEDTLQACGLQNYVNFETHIRGNTLDLVIGETNSSVRITECEQGELLSDHHSINFQISVPKDKIWRRTITNRNYKSFDKEKFVTEVLDLHNRNLKNVTDLANNLEVALKEGLNKNAPETTKTITVRPVNPWFNDELKEQKRRVRNREKIWRKYREIHQFQAFKNEQKTYKNMIIQLRRSALSSKVAEMKGDSKKLFKLVENLTGTETENPMPSNTSNEALADDFANFFYG